jgi:hypothetical protein
MNKQLAVLAKSANQFRSWSQTPRAKLLVAQGYKLHFIHGVEAVLGMQYDGIEHVDGFEERADAQIIEQMIRAHMRKLRK